MTLNLDGLMVAQVTPFTRGGAEVDLEWLADISNGCTSWG